MTDEQHSYWLRYIELLAGQLRLRDWVVILNRDSVEDGQHAAENQVRYGKRTLNLWLSSYFYVSSPEEQRSTIVHELLHAHFERIEAIVHVAFPEDEQPLFKRIHAKEWETVIDTMALIVADRLPLPEKKTG